MDGWVNGHENMGMEHRKISKSGCFFFMVCTRNFCEDGESCGGGKERTGGCLFDCTVRSSFPCYPFPSLPFHIPPGDDTIMCRFDGGKVPK